MNVKAITSAEAIQAYLSEIKHQEGRNYFSGFRGGLRDTRQATGRNLDTGEKKVVGNHGCWLGAIGYLVLLDQIGTTLKPKGAARATGNTINIALTYFTSLNKAERCALYALRCAFAHDFSLVNIPPAKARDRVLLQHHFIVDRGDNGRFIELPTIPWDGDIQNLDRSYMTYVNLEALGDMFEDIYHQLLNSSVRNELEIALPGGAEELLAKYMIVSPA